MARRAGLTTGKGNPTRRGFPGLDPPVSGKSMGFPVLTGWPSRCLEFLPLLPLPVTIRRDFLLGFVSVVPLAHSRGIFGWILYSRARFGAPKYLFNESGACLKKQRFWRFGDTSGDMYFREIRVGRPTSACDTASLSTRLGRWTSKRARRVPAACPGRRAGRHTHQRRTPADKETTCSRSAPQTAAADKNVWL